MESGYRRRDPILQVNIQSVQQKIYKAPVPTYMKVTSWLESKPKGIGRGEFYGQSEGSFRVGKDDLSAYRPTKKVYPIRPPYTIEKVEGTKKLVPQTNKNPILEPEKDNKISGKRMNSATHQTFIKDDLNFGLGSQGKKES